MTPVSSPVVVPATGNCVIRVLSWNALLRDGDAFEAYFSQRLVITKRLPVVVIVVVGVVPVVGIGDISGIRHNLAVASAHLIFDIIANI